VPSRQAVRVLLG